MQSTKIVAIILALALPALSDTIVDLSEGQSALFTWSAPVWATAASDPYYDAGDQEVTIQIGAFGQAPDSLSVQVFDSTGNALSIFPDGSTDGAYGEIMDTQIPPVPPGANYILWFSNNFEPMTIAADLNPSINYVDPPPNLQAALDELIGKTPPHGSDVPEPRTWALVLVGAFVWFAAVRWIMRRLPRDELIMCDDCYGTGCPKCHESGLVVRD